MGWIRRPVGAIREVPARKRLTAALLGPITAVALLAATCGKSDEPVGTGGPVETIAPFGSIVPLNGGSSLPDPALLLLRKANQDLKSGNFDAAAQAAQQARREARPGAEGSTKYIADAVEGVADINRNKIGTGLQLLQQGENAIKVVPDDIRVEMATLIYRAQVVGYARVGENAAAERSLNKALAVAPAPEADVIVKDLCRAAKEPNSIARCTPSSAVPPKPPSTKPTTGQSPEGHGLPENHDSSKDSKGNPTENNPTENNSRGNNPTGNNPAENKSTGNKSTGNNPAGNKSTGNKSTENNPTENKRTKDKPQKGESGKNDGPPTDAPSPRPDGS